MVAVFGVGCIGMLVIQGSHITGVQKQLQQMICWTMSRNERENLV